MSDYIIKVGKRKTAIARAIIRKGSGKFLINGYPIELYPIEILREKMLEPIRILGDRSKEIDIDVNVHGGGNTGQADATRTAMAKAIIEYFKDSDLEAEIRAYDRSMLVNDVRRKMPKKPMGYGARAKRQKSYR
ncbi:30S ribosomal protein S9 [Picrophilus oshimae]|uniref:Small ribosomal subunit protein uS9 n=2 Tax=Picrophilus torridus (strain ATCC 700027 / DSM 9790 / JCM 10055 / NBRC 100828 / KAW 2/3) TaxID=1122961 RepID=RS9_PICTO|nr:30S ribosomal protein S9 [Picrophilus oshimae]Q6L293.1 RecName: Full=Small ribosomal subunit protein uS9; AltName: Full=30S ribosomal protein S9 [Picrophilus oshimae DSM 9789]AAT42909.1 small subunit ribosomal protein S9P [Picrophilus oshimae DSM 9789]SMD30780.1 SSU ribosomal protein S9P [Picrophilus oshimae DSM 9789]